MQEALGMIETKVALAIVPHSAIPLKHTVRSAASKKGFQSIRGYGLHVSQLEFLKTGKIRPQRVNIPERLNNIPLHIPQGTADALQLRFLHKPGNRGCPKCHLQAGMPQDVHASFDRREIDRDPGCTRIFL